MYAVKKIFRQPRWRIVIAAAFIVATGALLISKKDSAIDANYTELLNAIAQGESKGNYNAYFGNAGNTAVNFTGMTVGEVLAWQDDFVRQGNASNAVGKYQFIRPTLAGLVRELGISKSARFDAALQDKLAIRLLERRGVNDYLHGRITREQLAHNLSKEWAALPRVIGGNPSASYYAGDGLNNVQISIAEIFAAIESLHSADKM